MGVDQRITKHCIGRVVCLQWKTAIRNALWVIVTYSRTTRARRTQLAVLLGPKTYVIMVYFQAFGCSNRSGKGCNLTFHSVPNQAKRSEL